MRDPHVANHRRSGRKAISLLEVIIATAILASSAMLVSSMIGRASKLGQRAESRTAWLNVAQSLLEETVAGLQSGAEVETEASGPLPDSMGGSYRVSVSPFMVEAARDASPSDRQTDSSPGNPQSQLVIVAVDIFNLPGASAIAEQSAEIHLSRLARTRSPAQGGSLAPNRKTP